MSKLEGHRINPATGLPRAPLDNGKVRVSNRDATADEAVVVRRAWEAERREAVEGLLGGVCGPVHEPWTPAVTVPTIGGML